MLTVVIPAKNEETSLPRLLASIKRQTLQPEEIIVADAHSTDKTREVAESFGAKVVEGGLPGPGRNRGAAHAETEFILFLDADVELDDPTFFEKAIASMREKKLDLATCDVFPMDGTKLDRVLHAAYNKYVRTVGKLLPHAPGFCMLVAKSLHEQIKGFDESVTFCEDHDYARRASKKGRFGFLEMKVPVSVRRMDRDGRARIAFKFVLAELHLATIGPIRHNLFKYSFGHKKDV